jgi:hypothetical protein
VDVTDCGQVDVPPLRCGGGGIGLAGTGTAACREVARAQTGAPGAGQPDSTAPAAPDAGVRRRIGRGGSRGWSRRVAASPAAGARSAAAMAEAVSGRTAGPTATVEAAPRGARRRVSCRRVSCAAAEPAEVPAASPGRGGLLLLLSPISYLSAALFGREATEAGQVDAQPFAICGRVQLGFLQRGPLQKLLDGGIAHVRLTLPGLDRIQLKLGDARILAGVHPCCQCCTPNML